jgi:hypothetical protein
MPATSAGMTEVGVLGQVEAATLPRRRRAGGGSHRHGGRERRLLGLPALPPGLLAPARLVELAQALQLFQVALDAVRGRGEEIAKRAR